MFFNLKHMMVIITMRLNNFIIMLFKCKMVNVNNCVGFNIKALIEKTINKNI